jgi:hypothetical protein
MAELFAEQPNGMDGLVYLGGWTNPLSARRYIQRSLAKQAKEALRGYHRKLHEEAAKAQYRPKGSDLPPLWSRVMSLDGQLVDASAVCWRFVVRWRQGDSYSLGPTR